MDDLLPVLHVEIIAMGHGGIAVLARKGPYLLPRFQVIDIIGRDQVVLSASQEAAGIVIVLALGRLQRHRQTPFFAQDLKGRVLPAGHRLPVGAQQRVGVEPVLVDGLKEAVLRIRQQAILAGNQHFAVRAVKAIEAGIRVAGDEIMGLIHVFQAVHVQLHGHEHISFAQGCSAHQHQGHGH